jgi:hypothetical protein
MKKQIFILLISVITAIQAETQNVTVTGAPNFNLSDLFVTEAGEDFNPVIAESMSGTYLNISGLGHNTNYTLYANLAQMQGSIVLEVIRLTDGNQDSGGGAVGRIEGGNNTFIQLTTTPVPFFTGRGTRNNVLIGFRLRNLSVIQPAGNVPFSVVFTAQVTN